MNGKSDLSEKILLDDLKNGNADAFNKLFAEYGKRLYHHFAFGYLKSKEKAEGVVQEVFLIVWRNRKQPKTDLLFKAYLFKIAYHHILEFFKKANLENDYKHKTIDNSMLLFK